MSASNPAEDRDRSEEHAIEWLIPNDAADYLEPRPNEPRYAKPLVLPDGTSVDLNKPGPFRSPAPEGSLTPERLLAEMREMWEQECEATAEARRAQPPPSS